jgi:hypothetical protein
VVTVFNNELAAGALDDVLRYNPVKLARQFPVPVFAIVQLTVTCSPARAEYVLNEMSRGTKFGRACANTFAAKPTTNQQPHQATIRRYKLRSEKIDNIILPAPPPSQQRHFASAPTLPAPRPKTNTINCSQSVERRPRSYRQRFSRRPLMHNSVLDTRRAEGTSEKTGLEENG